MPEPGVGPYTSPGETRARQQGVYGMGRFSLADPLTLVLGGRMSWWNQDAPGSRPVSYTHLDVYKRQILRYLAARHGAEAFWPADPARRVRADGWMDWAQTALQPAFLVGVFWGYYRTPVSYTHLDVYKRQWRCRCRGSRASARRTRPSGRPRGRRCRGTGFRPRRCGRCCSPSAA